MRRFGLNNAPALARVGLKYETLGEQCSAGGLDSGCDRWGGHFFGVRGRWVSQTISGK